MSEKLPSQCPPFDRFQPNAANYHIESVQLSRRTALGALASVAATSAVGSVIGTETGIAKAKSPISAPASVAFSRPASKLHSPKPTLQLKNLHVMDLRLSGSPRLARRATVFTPSHGCVGRLPVLVLLHGLGETSSETAGAYAWVQRYGLGGSYDRLVRPPVDVSGAAEAKKYAFLTRSRARELNRSLQFQPFRGLILVCPYTPNVFAMPTRQAVTDYADWLVQVLLPEVRVRTPALSEPRYTGIDGCSLGGYISLQVFQRRPRDFYSCGAVQAAFGKDAADGYASRLREIIDQYGEHPIHLQTSSQDPYRDANVLLSKYLSQRSVHHQLRISPGPHNQSWLIDVGTLELLLWHERQLHRT